jgi:N-acyl-D-amino-acid deacylase
VRYDTLVKNAVVIDGCGAPAARADVGIVDGRIAELGQLSVSASRTIEGNRDDPRQR